MKNKIGNVGDYMKKVGICGYYGEGSNFEGGQPVKVKQIIRELGIAIGENNIQTISTYNWRKTPIKLLEKCFLLTKKSENIIILPASNGVKVFVPLFVFFNYFFNRKIFYIVIGGWLPNLLDKKKWLIKYLKKLDGIFVETKTMLKRMDDLEFDNVYYMPNFKRLTILNESDLVYENNIPFRLCTFSRVMKEKGIEDAINAVIEINELSNRIIYSLDIYGPIDEKYINRFEEMRLNLHNYISYKGIVDFNNTVEVLKNYYMLLFPTQYDTEGVPGTIIDSYFAGVPVLAAKWQSFSDVIEDGVTGIGFEFRDYREFLSKLNWCAENSDIINNMKIECLRKAKEYSPEHVMCEFLKHL